jgi:hypothetical protein
VSFAATMSRRSGTLRLSHFGKAFGVVTRMGTTVTRSGMGPSVSPDPA